MSIDRGDGRARPEPRKDALNQPSSLERTAIAAPVKVKLHIKLPSTPIITYAPNFDYLTVQRMVMNVMNIQVSCQQ